MKQRIYFEVVDQKINWPLYGLFATEEEARQQAACWKADGELPNPVYIRKTVCKLTAKGKTARKYEYNLGLA